MSGLSGDTVSFRIQVNQIYDDNGGVNPNPSWLTGGFIAEDFYLVDTSGTPTIIGSGIDSTADPFHTQPGLGYQYDEKFA